MKLSRKYPIKLSPQLEQEVRESTVTYIGVGDPEDTMVARVETKLPRKAHWEETPRVSGLRKTFWISLRAITIALAIMVALPFFLQARLQQQSDFSENAPVMAMPVLEVSPLPKPAVPEPLVLENAVEESMPSWRR